MSIRGSYVTLTVEQKLAIVREAETAQKKGEVAIATIPFSEFVAVDDAVQTVMELTDEEIASSIRDEAGERNDSESENEEEINDEPSVPVTTSCDAKKMLNCLRAFFEGKEEVPEEVFRAVDLLDHHTSTSQKQSKITSYISTLSAKM